MSERWHGRKPLLVVNGKPDFIDVVLYNIIGYELQNVVEMRKRWLKLGRRPTQELPVASAGGLIYTSQSPEGGTRFCFVSPSGLRLKTN
jgi:hypothetical protein